jgi:hypothetical protein
MPRRVTRRRHGLETRQGVETGRLARRPNEFLVTNPDGCVREQSEVDRLVVMRVREDHVGHVFRLDALGLQLLRQFASNIESADIHQRHTALLAQQRDGAPAKTTVAKSAPMKTL